MELRIRLGFMALLAFLPFLSTHAYAIDSNELAAQVVGQGCSYVTNFDTQDSYKFLSKYDPEPLACRKNTTLFKKLFTGSIGCRLHAVYCLYEAPAIDSEARASLHEALTVDPESFDYAGIRGSDLQLAAVRVLGKHRNRSSVQALSAALIGEEALQSEVLEALASYGTDAASVFDTIALLKLPHDSLYIRWLDTLAAIDPERSIPLLSAGLKRDNPRERQQAMKLLREAQSLSNDSAVLLTTLLDPATAAEAAKAISRESLKNESLVSALQEILAASANDSESVHRDTEILKALSKSNSLPEMLCKEVKKRVEHSTTFKIFEASLTALRSSCENDPVLNVRLINRLAHLPPSMRTKSIAYLGSRALSQEQYNTILCYGVSLSNDVRKALYEIPETHGQNCTLYIDDDNQNRSSELDIEAVRESVYREEHLRSLLLKWIANGAAVKGFTVNFTTTHIRGSKSFDHSYRPRQYLETGSILYEAPRKLRIESFEQSSTETRALEIINGTHGWTVREGPGAYGTTRVYEDIYRRPPYVDSKPLIQVKSERRFLISGLTGRYQNDYFFTDIEYIESYTEGEQTLHLLAHRKPHGSAHYHVSEEGLIVKHELIYGSSNPARWDTDYPEEQKREITVYQDFQTIESADPAAFEYSPSRKASWIRRTYTKKGIQEETIRE